MLCIQEKQLSRLTLIISGVVDANLAVIQSTVTFRNEQINYGGSWS